jgi:hypothetical protein
MHHCSEVAPTMCDAAKENRVLSSPFCLISRAGLLQLALPSSFFIFLFLFFLLGRSPCRSSFLCWFFFRWFLSRRLCSLPAVCSLHISLLICSLVSASAGHHILQSLVLKLKKSCFPFEPVSGKVWCSCTAVFSFLVYSFHGIIIA